MASEARRVLFLFKSNGVVGFDRHFAGRHARVAGDLRSALAGRNLLSIAVHSQIETFSLSQDAPHLPVNIILDSLGLFTQIRS